MNEAVAGETVSTREAIEQVLFAYARGVDRKDRALVRSAYHPDATDTHGDYDGGIDGFIDQLVRRHEDIDQSIHLITNVMVERIDPGTALVESYYLCYQRLKSAAKVEAAFGAAAPGSGETLQLMAVGRYIDWFERRDSIWKIARRKVTFDLLQATPTPTGGGLDARLLLSRRDRDDVLWRELEGR